MYFPRPKTKKKKLLLKLLIDWNELCQVLHFAKRWHPIETTRIG